MMTILENWRVVMGGRRNGANITVTDGERQISGTVTGWLDGDALHCRRSAARFVQVRRWSYDRDTMQIPQTFAVPIEEIPGPSRDSGGVL